MQNPPNPPPYGTPPPGSYGYPPPGYPPPQKSNTGKIVLTTCGVLLLVFVLVIAGLFMIGEHTLKKTPAALSRDPAMAFFQNSRDGLNADLTQNYQDFSFQYPKTWTLNREGTKPGASNFVKVERMDSQQFTLENFAVGYLWVKGNPTPEQLRAKMPDVAGELSAQMGAQFPNYHQVSEGETTVNAYGAYQFLFQAKANNTALWGRVVIIPGTGPVQNGGVVLVMLASDHSPAVKGPEDLGVKGELPGILNSFHMGR